MIFHQSPINLTAGFRHFTSKFCYQTTHECSSSPGWTTWAASEASLCSDEGERCFHSCLWLRALASPHVDNTLPHNLTHTLSSLPKFPSIHSREWRLHPCNSRCTAEAAPYCEHQKTKLIISTWIFIFSRLMQYNKRCPCFVGLLSTKASHSPPSPCKSSPLGL